MLALKKGHKTDEWGPVIQVLFYENFRFSLILFQPEENVQTSC